MKMAPIPLRSLKTDRLVVRATIGADAQRAFEIQSDWEVTRMLCMASFPPDREEIQRWFAVHHQEWRTGEAYRFAAELKGKMIGVVDIDSIVDHEGTLGFWFDRAAWGCGYAFEAAQAVTQFAFRDIGLLKLKAGHAHDNRASGRILTKLGFSFLDTVQRFSRPRGETITQHRYALTPQE